MNTYTIDGVTYIVHDGKLFCELAPDTEEQPAAATAAKKQDGRPSKVAQAKKAPHHTAEYYEKKSKKTVPTAEQPNIVDEGFPFTAVEKTTIVGLYKLGIGYHEIAKKFKSNRGEIAIYIAHLIEAGELTQRQEREPATSPDDELTELD